VIIRLHVKLKENICPPTLTRQTGPEVFCNTSPLIVMEVMISPSVSIKGDRDSSVGIETCDGLDGPAIECRWGARFSAPVLTTLGPT
jgi:hypothetical protein